MKRLTSDRFLADAELEAFMAAVRARRHKNQPRDHAFFALLANTGIRPSEALALTPEACRLSGPRPSLDVARLKKRTPRTDRLVITRELAALLSGYVGAREAGRPVFAFTRRQAERLFHHYASAAGIRRKVHLYVLRHTAATRIYRVTRDIEIVQAILGHESAETSAIYAHVTPDMLREMVETYPVTV